MIEVSEIFGPTLQGEGPSLGHPAKFLRLRRCNLACDWCDTKFTWDPKDPDYKNYREMLHSEIIYEIGIQDLVVITGGEPLIWRRQLNELLDLLPKWKRIEIETNGTIHPKDLANRSNVYFNVSPKLENSGNKGLRTFDYAVLRSFVLYPGAIFKFVCTDPSDLRVVVSIARDIELDHSRIYIMPEGVTARRQLSGIGELFKVCAKMGFNLTPRLHTLAFGNERGI